MDLLHSFSPVSYTHLDVYKRQQQVKAGNKNNLKIYLKESSIALNEIVVVGYGSQSEKLVTTSISSTDFPHDKILGAVFFGKQGAAVFVIALVFAFCHRQLPP